MTRSLLVAILCALVFPSVSSAAVSECGDPPGPARNVTAVGVSCSDARSFARKAADQGPTSSGTLSLAGWQTYKATVKRAGSEYDVRATRGSKVIRFQYRPAGSSGGNCDPNYEGACLKPNSPDYDCAGGSGNGPDYTGPVRVVGDDHYDLDRDGDGEACET